MRVRVDRTRRNPDDAHHRESNAIYKVRGTGNGVLNARQNIVSAGPKRSGLA